MIVDMHAPTGADDDDDDGLDVIQQRYHIFHFLRRLWYGTSVSGTSLQNRSCNLNPIVHGRLSLYRQDFTISQIAKNMVPKRKQCYRCCCRRGFLVYVLLLFLNADSLENISTTHIVMLYHVRIKLDKIL